MFVTLEVTQLLMSSLKLAQSGLQPKLVESVKLKRQMFAQKTYDRSVTRDTSHAPMWPYVAAAVNEVLHHASRATSSEARSTKMKPSGA